MWKVDEYTVRGDFDLNQLDDDQLDQLMDSETAGEHVKEVTRDGYDGRKFILCNCCSLK